MANLTTKDEWLAYAKENAPELTLLIANYHPVRLASLVSNTPQFHDEITAHGAEHACAHIREAIAGEEAEKADPVSRFQRALAQADVGEIMGLLNSAWFGVPENASCWGLVGFKEAVDLLEQPPDEVEFGAGE